MPHSIISYLLCLMSCVYFQLTSGQVNSSNHNENLTLSQTNLTSNQLFTKWFNTSIAQDYKENTQEPNENTTDITNMCDNIACINNIQICQINQCNGIKRIRKIHYIVTCIIVVGVILLMLATMYACRQESKRSIEWRNAHDRCEEHLMAIRVLQSVNRSIEMRNFQEIRPLQVTDESPPPYDEHTPPPNYQEATSHLFTYNQK